MATATMKPKVPGVKQVAVLEALTPNRRAEVVEAGGKRSVVLKTLTGKPAKDAPKLDRAALEAAQKNGWVGENGLRTPAGTLALKAARKAASIKNK